MSVDGVESVKLNILVLFNDVAFDLLKLLYLVFTLNLLSSQLVDLLLLGFDFRIFF